MIASGSAGDGDEEGTLGRDLDRAFGNCAKARGALGEQVG